MPLVRISLIEGKTVSVKIQDVFISLIEVKKESWSFGNGIAQYAI